MPYTKDAITILTQTHERLRELLANALETHAYEDVASIARIADNISRLLNGSAGPMSSLLPNTQPVPTKAGNTKRSRARHDLPRFERDGDRLVKIAWSKKDRAEYEHRAPLSVVFVLLDAIRERKGEGAVFETPDILPLPGPHHGEEVPSYQAYLVLAWLRQEGIVIKHGRNGYILTPNTATPERIDELWKALPSARW
jgi:hypothetical protein